jgi:hypothetical protein
MGRLRDLGASFMPFGIKILAAAARLGGIGILAIVAVFAAGAFMYRDRTRRVLMAPTIAPAQTNPVVSDLSAWRMSGQALQPFDFSACGGNLVG